MSGLYTIKIAAAAPVSTADAGFILRPIERRNFAVESFSFIAQAADLTAAFAYGYLNAVNLYLDGTCIFVGFITRRIREADDQARRHVYLVSNGWWKMRRITYQQPYVLKTTDFSALTGSYSSHVILGQDVWGHKITTNAQILNIITYAATQGAGVSLATSLPSLLTPWLREARDINCAEAIGQMIQFTPDCVGWFDYSAESCKLHIQRRTSLDAVTLDLADQNLVEVIRAIQPLDDLLIRGVKFTFLTTATDDAGKVWARETIQTAGASSGEGIVTATIELANQGTDQAEAVPTGAADAYYAARGTLQFAGSIRLRGRYPGGQVKVGNILNLASGDPAWATMNATVQAVTEDPLTGTTDVEIGAPEHLGPQDFVAMLIALRQRFVVSPFSSSQHNGDAGFGGDVPPNPDAGGDPASNPDAGSNSIDGANGSESITHCVDGVQQTSIVAKGR